MMPWEFVVEKPHDLPFFADLLEEHSHPGHRVVRWLVKRKKFPAYCPESNGWSWFVSSTVQSEHYFLPDYLIGGYHYFYTPTEAIWCAINSWLFNRDKCKRLKI